MTTRNITTGTTRPVLDALLLDGGLLPRPADDLPRCGDGQARQEGVHGRFGLVFGLKMCGYVL